jgi:hypothetical protein
MTETILLPSNTNSAIIVTNSVANGLQNGSEKSKEAQQKIKEIDTGHGQHEPPDGGYGWLVMIAAFFCNGILFGIINTYCVVYLSLQRQLTELGDSEASSKAGQFGNDKIFIGWEFYLNIMIWETVQFCSNC